MLRHSINAIAPRFVFYIVLTCLVIRSSADVVDLPGWAPICVFNPRSFLSASLEICLAIIALRVFASVLRRATGLYGPSFEYSGFCGFLSTTVIDSCG